MASLLHRLGLSSYRRPWRVLVVWLLALGALLRLGVGLGGQMQESFAIPGTESQNAIDKLEAVFPQTSGGSAQVVQQAPEGESVGDDDHRAAIEELAEDIEELDGVAAVTTPFSEYATDSLSDDGRVGITQVQFDEASDQVSDATIAALVGTAPTGEASGLRIEFGGQVFQDNTFGITITEVFGVLFAGVVLVITFGSLLAAGLPLLSALVGVGLAMGGILSVAAFATVSNTAPMLALMIGLAVGIDYSLFILSRHRTQLALGTDPAESAATSVATAGSAVVFAGLTVIIALLGLLVVGIPFLSVMGVAAAAAVLIAVVAAVTLLPAMLGLAGTRLAPKPGSRTHRRALATAGVAEAGTHGHAPTPSLGMRWVGLILKAPIVAVLAVVALLGSLLIPALQLQLSLPDNGSEPAGSTQREAYDLVSEAFGPGRNGPLVVLVDITQTTDIFGDLGRVADELRDLDDVRAVSDGLPNQTVDTAVIQVIPGSAPDSAETTALVERIRDLAPEIEDRYGLPISVAGTTAVMIDISTTLGNALLPFGAIVVGLSVLLLMMVFRSLFVPVKAALGFLLSVIGSFGVVVLVFQQGLFADLLHVEPGPILSFLPILLMAVLFGLAMDYEVFLVSGMREEYVRTGDAQQAVRSGFAHAARVVTAAALIMFFVFFAFVPEGSGAIKPIALALAVGIAFDAFLVRMTLVPAAMALAGRTAWYLPAWLGRILPNVDIEGEGLAERRHGEDWAETQRGFAVSAEGLRARSGGIPLDLRVPAGTLAVLSGEPAERRAVLAAVAGRLEPAGGRLQVLGVPAPGDAGGIRRLVTLATLSGAEPGGTLAGLLRDRVGISDPWHRIGGGARRAQAWLDRADRALAARGRPTLDPDTAPEALAPLERAVFEAALAAASGAPVLALDAPDVAHDSAADLLAAVSDTVPSSVTVLLGVPDDLRLRSLPAPVARDIVPIDLTPKVLSR
ncbi:MMPL family transporter [Lysobacter korlensis]|uniref:MMPL family transporter n=1 Tax=Lysobacter korlensis TaxID=553636 RepID=A0ABV6RXY0_9GAMM